MYILCMIILVFFAVIGLCAFVTSLLDQCYKGSTDAELILKNLTPENAESSIRSAAHICQRHRGIRLVIICDESDPAYDLCKLMQKDYPFMEIIPTDRN